MSTPIVGWEETHPVPDGHQFNHYLTAQNGRLHLNGLDLMSLFESPIPTPQNDHQILPSPLEVVYLPLIRHQIQKMNQIFAKAIAETTYEGTFLYAYASKANAAEEVIRTTLQAGAHHEMSSTVDVDIAHIMIKKGLLPPDRYILCNGFKPANSNYAANIIGLRQVHKKVVPIIEDMAEIPPFLASGYNFDVGLRQKSYGNNKTPEEMDNANSRFGFDMDTIWKAADYISAAPNLNLTLFHNMVGSQLTDPDDFIDRLKPGIEVYGRLRQRHPNLHIFNFGGGMPVAMTLDFEFDYEYFATKLLSTFKETCQRYNVPVPDIMGEFGRYTTSEHGAHLFKILLEKDNGSDLPWYIINGSIMSSFPDSWALSEHFIVLPLNHLDQPFKQVQLGGITCDSDDVFPPKPSNSPLFLPVDSENLYIGFFSIGAYQEMLGGVKGSKHCVLPEAYELIIDRENPGTPYTFNILSGQTTEEVLNNLGYALD